MNHRFIFIFLVLHVFTLLFIIELTHGVTNIFNTICNEIINLYNPIAIDSSDQPSATQNTNPTKLSTTQESNNVNTNYATQAPTTQAPTTQVPTTQAPTTQVPTSTQVPTRQTPNTQAPTTQAPTSTQVPTIQVPTRQTPTTQITNSMTTYIPTQAPTSVVITQVPTTGAPTSIPTTKITNSMTTYIPTQAPTTQAPTTQAPTTQAPTTQAPTTQAPTTQAPTTQAPTTQAPTTQAPTTQAPTTQAPTIQPPGTINLNGYYYLPINIPSTITSRGGVDQEINSTTLSQLYALNEYSSYLTSRDFLNGVLFNSNVSFVLNATKFPFITYFYYSSNYDGTITYNNVKYTVKSNFDTNTVNCIQIDSTGSQVIISTINIPTNYIITPAPTTRAPTTQAPTTRAPTTQAPTTQAPTSYFLPINVPSVITTNNGMNQPINSTSLSPNSYADIAYFYTFDQLKDILWSGTKSYTLTPTKFPYNTYYYYPSTFNSTITYNNNTYKLVSGIDINKNIINPVPINCIQIDSTGNYIKVSTVYITIPTLAPTTQAPTTQAPTTQAPTTQAPTTQAPTSRPPPPTRAGGGQPPGTVNLNGYYYLPINVPSVITSKSGVNQQINSTTLAQYNALDQFPPYWSTGDNLNKVLFNNNISFILTPTKFPFITYYYNTTNYDNVIVTYNNTDYTIKQNKNTDTVNCIQIDSTGNQVIVSVIKIPTNYIITTAPTTQAPNIVINTSAPNTFNSSTGITSIYAVVNKNSNTYSNGVPYFITPIQISFNSEKLQITISTTDTRNRYNDAHVYFGYFENNQFIQIDMKDIWVQDPIFYVDQSSLSKNYNYYINVTASDPGYKSSDAYASFTLNVYDAGFKR